MTKKIIGGALCQCGREYDIVAFSEKNSFPEGGTVLVEHVDALPSNIQIEPHFKPGTFKVINGELAGRISRQCNGLWNSGGRTVICNGVEYFVVLYYSGEEFWTRKVKPDG